MRHAVAAAAALLLLQSSAPPTPTPQQFRFLRTITPAAGSAPGQMQCTVLDAEVYAGSRPGLSDLRLFAGAAEVPYALTLSQTAPLGDPATVLNQGRQGRQVVFDLKMPERPYTEVELTIDGHNFMGTANVTGQDSLDPRARRTRLQPSAIFDLTRQHLGRSTALSMQESTFPYLHVALDLKDLGSTTGPPGVKVLNAEVPPSRNGQTLYTVLAQSSQVEQKDNSTVVRFHIPAHVPVERVRFTLAPGSHTNFSRDVTVSGSFPDDPGAIRAGIGSESLSGTIMRVHLPANSTGPAIDQEQLAVPAVLGINASRDMQVEVTVHNGSDQPIALASVQLEMRQRKLCFEAAETQRMYYGDAGLAAPVYDFSRLFRTGDNALTATLGPQQLNPDYKPQAKPAQPFTERHPGLLWAALLASILVLGRIAFRSARRV